MIPLRSIVGSTGYATSAENCFPSLATSLTLAFKLRIMAGSLTACQGLFIFMASLHRRNPLLCSRLTCQKAHCIAFWRARQQPFGSVLLLVSGLPLPRLTCLSSCQLPHHTCVGCVALLALLCPWALPALLTCVITTLFVPYWFVFSECQSSWHFPAS